MSGISLPVLGVVLYPKAGGLRRDTVLMRLDTYGTVVLAAAGVPVPGQQWAHWVVTKSVEQPDQARVHERRQQPAQGHTAL